MRWAVPLSIVLLLASVTSVRAGDGVLEINQACAVNTGCFAGDTAGFPVTIDGTAGRSYRLTGDLLVPQGDTGILLDADEIHLDLNGFRIAGPPGCDPALANCASAGVSVAVRKGYHSTVRDGILHSFDGVCLELGNSSQVKGIDASACFEGIVVGSECLVVENRVSNTLARGLMMGLNCAFASNVVTGAGVSGPADAVANGIQTSGNVCDDGTCRPFGARRFYLTKTAFRGDVAGAQCDPGFHVAHLSEILDPSSLRYDIARGYQIAGGGLGQGAPFLVPGWLYLTINHCSDYAGGFPSGAGTSAQLSTGSNDIPGTPWLVNSSDACGSTWRVWCAED